MILDPIGDLLTRIRNAYMARIELVEVPYSRIKSDILKILKKNKYVAGYEVVEDGHKKNISISLNSVKVTKYVPTFKRISRPGQRIYLGS